MLSFDFMQRAFAAGIITAVIISIIGVFVVLKRMAPVGDSLSHAALAGVAGGMLTGFYPFYGAMIFCIFASLLIEIVRQSFQKYAEIALVVVMSGSMGLAVVLISIGKSFNADLFSYLFGSLVAVSVSDLYVIIVSGIIILLTLSVFRRELFTLTFDEESAIISGVPVKLINSIFSVLTSLAVTLSLRVVGGLMVSALMVIPAAVSLQLCKSFKSAFMIAVITALTSVILGLYISFIFDLAPGGTTVLVAAGILLTVIFIKGALKRWN
ncbi:MAG: metal ABC transporter permease [Tepidanaerobacteraceae bacterium]